MEQKSPEYSLEILVEKIRNDLSNILKQPLIVADSGEKDKKTFYIGKFVRRNFFTGREKYDAILMAEETQIKAGNKKITIYSNDEEIREIVKKYRQQYMAENPEISYFTILKGQKFPLMHFGFS